MSLCCIFNSINRFVVYATVFLHFIRSGVLEFKIGICQVVIPPPGSPASVTKFYEIGLCISIYSVQPEGQERCLRRAVNFFLAKFFCRVRRIAKSDCWLCHVCLSVRVASVCPHRKTRLPRTDFRDVIFWALYMLNLKTESATCGTTRNIRHDETNLWILNLTFSRLMIYIYIYMSYRTANLQILHFIYSTNIRTEYFKQAAPSPFFHLQNAVYFIMLPFLVPVLFTF